MSAPLYDERAERDYLGACIYEPSTLEAGALGPEAMSSGDHRLCLSAMLALRQRGEPVDSVSVRTELERLGWDRMRAATYTLALTETVPPPAASIASRLRLYQDARRIVAEASLGLSHAGRLELDEAREKLTQAAMGATSEAEVLSTRGLMEAAGQAWHEVSEERIREERGQPVRYVSLALGREPGSRTVRLGPGEMLAVGAATGVGKSSMALTELVGLEDRGVPAGLVSVEDPAEAWGSKLVGYRGKVDTGGMWAGAASNDDWQRAHRAVHHAASAADCIRVVHAKTATIDEVVQCMSRLVRVHGARVLFVDYLQAVTAPTAKGMTRRDATDLVLARLLSAARALGVPLVLMSQLSRSEKSNRFPEPHLGDLKESGTLENSATAVLLLWITTDDDRDKGYGVVRAKLAKDKRQQRGARWAMRRGYGQVLAEIDGWTEPQSELTGEL